MSMEEELVPVEQVLNDMYNPDGGPISWAARDYYKLHYATKEEIEEMEREETFDTVISCIFWFCYGLLLILAIVT